MLRSAMVICTPLSVSLFLLLCVVKGYIAAFAGTYSYGIVYRDDEDTAITDLARSRRIHHSIHSALHVDVSYITPRYILA